ncbi:MAG: hypothetical protein KGI38_12440, partial [Thaumarchaeota archaeon]|nr:hypothetical protein [Nitrososphaerota archaeon]
MTTNTVPPYGTTTNASPSVPGSATAFPSTPVANQVGIREAVHVPLSLATEPVTFSNSSPPVTVQQALDELNKMPSDRLKEIQQQMFDGGLLTKRSDVSGNVNTATASKWKDIVLEAATSGNSIQAHLDIAGNSQVYSQIGNDLQKEQTSLQKAIVTPKNLNIPLTNDAVLRAYLQAGFAQAEGHSPTEQELDTFVQSFHNQEIASGETQLAEPRQFDQQALGRVQGELSDLKNLGPNGLDVFVQAYRQVMSGNAGALGVTGQGPEVQGAPPKTPFENATGQPANPLAPLTTNHGGVFGMSPQTWTTAAKAANVDVKKYPTPTSAPTSIQTAVFSTFAESQYQKLGNWADVATVMAGGKPGDTSQPAFNGGSSLGATSFGAKVAQEVNSQLSNFTSQINAPGPDNIVAAASADTSGAAAKQAADQAAKESDPAGYYAHQITLYEGLLDKMATGTLPQQDITSSTVSGPVAPIAAPTPA